jgi:MOSC domain-containing protein YiiM
VRGPVVIAPLGLTGDEQADLSVHGGPDKAVYFYPSEHYATWAREFPEHHGLFTPGGFGENLTTSGLIENTVAIGGIFSVGNALLQVTQPRQPCFKLAIRFNDRRLGRAMLRSGRTGWYARVVTAGAAAGGDTVILLDRPSAAWTIRRFADLIARGKTSIEELVELMELPGLPMTWREIAARAVTIAAERAVPSGAPPRGPVHVAWRS